MSAMAAVSVDEATSARSELYGLLADALEFPSREFHARVLAGAFRDEVAELVRALPYDIGEAVDPVALAEVEEYVEFQSEYIRLFDVGPVRPPCPLYGGEWGGARKRTMEETLRFYRFFGLKMGEEAHELPDHVTVELEFMKVIAFAEGMARAREKDPLPFLRAERDFLERHPGRWFPMLRRKLPALKPPRFYDALTGLTDAVLAADQRYVRSLIV